MTMIQDIRDLFTEGSPNCVNESSLSSFPYDNLSLCRKASLALIRKMIHYIQPNLLLELTDPDLLTINFASQLVEVLAIVLDCEV